MMLAPPRTLLGPVALALVLVTSACGSRDAAELEQAPSDTYECAFNTFTGEGDPGNHPSCPPSTSPEPVPTGLVPSAAEDEEERGAFCGYNGPNDAPDPGNDPEICPSIKPTYGDE